MHSALQTELVWLVYCTHLWRTGHSDPLTWRARRWGSLTGKVTRTISKQVGGAWCGWRVRKRKKKEHQGEDLVCARQQTAARITNSVVKEKSRVAVSTLVHWATRLGLASVLTWELLDSLFHSFFYATGNVVVLGKFIIFFNSLTLRKGYFEGLSYIFEKRKSVIHIFLCMFTGTKII